MAAPTSSMQKRQILFLTAGRHTWCEAGIVPLRRRIPIQPGRGHLEAGRFLPRVLSRKGKSRPRPVSSSKPASMLSKVKDQIGVRTFIAVTNDFAAIAYRRLAPKCKCRASLVVATDEVRSRVAVLFETVGDA